MPTVIPYGLQIGSAFNATIDPKLKTPYSIAFNGGMQHAFAGDLVMKLSYAGRLGRRLLAQTDANQVLDFPDPVSGQTLGQAFGERHSAGEGRSHFRNRDSPAMV